MIDLDSKCYKKLEGILEDKQKTFFLELFNHNIIMNNTDSSDFTLYL